MLTNLQELTIKAIVSIFETGRLTGNYGAIARNASDKGGFSYGLHQASLNSGNLANLLIQYLAIADDQHKSLLLPFMGRVKNRDSSLNTDNSFYTMMKTISSDLTMHEAQDTFFDEEFFVPAQKRAVELGLKTALGVAVLYDSTIHGSREKIVNRVTATRPINGGDEQKWVTEYVTKRLDWLKNSDNALLRNTVYRMQTFVELLQLNNWDLTLPLSAHGKLITEEVLK